MRPGSDQVTYNQVAIQSIPGNYLFAELIYSLRNFAQGGTFLDDTNTAVRVADHGHTACRASIETLARIGDKWTVLVVGALARGPIRYNQVRRVVEGISQRMLTLTLKGLEQDGLVSRTVYPTIPPRVDYELTDLGRTLIVPLKAVHAWTVEHQPAMLAAREKFAERERQAASWQASFTTPK
jgi:DNA-binding HxlR family transcriptional regulator